jgi:chloramphenicol 3-O-phosphotransferase
MPPAPVAPGQVIIVSGSSGSGKSTTCRTFAQQADDFWLMLGVDLFSGMMSPAKFSMHGPRCREGQYARSINPDDPDGGTMMALGPEGWRAMQAFHAMIAAAARAGRNVIVDHIMFVDPPILQDCVWQLEGLPVHFVGLQPPEAVLLGRIGGREIKVPPDFAESIGADAAARVARNLQRLTPWFVRAINDAGCFDLVVDSEALSPSQVCAAITTRLAAGPGTAFATLRERHPRGSWDQLLDPENRSFE